MYSTYMHALDSMRSWRLTLQFHRPLYSRRRVQFRHHRVRPGIQLLWPHYPLIMGRLPVVVVGHRRWWVWPVFIVWAREDVSPAFSPSVQDDRSRCKEDHCPKSASDAGSHLHHQASLVVALWIASWTPGGGSAAADVSPQVAIAAIAAATAAGTVVAAQAGSGSGRTCRRAVAGVEDVEAQLQRRTGVGLLLAGYLHGSLVYSAHGISNELPRQKEEQEISGTEIIHTVRKHPGRTHALQTLRTEVDRHHKTRVVVRTVVVLQRHIRLQQPISHR